MILVQPLNIRRLQSATSKSHGRTRPLNIEALVHEVHASTAVRCSFDRGDPVSESQQAAFRRQKPRRERSLK